MKPKSSKPKLPAEQVVKVTYQNFGNIGDGEKAQQFVDSIDATSDYAATLLADAHQKAGWRRVPGKVAINEWISLVKVKIGAIFHCKFTKGNTPNQNW